MKLRYAAFLSLLAALAACQSSPGGKTAWLMQGNAPWVSPDGECMQLRPLTPEEKHGFCYEVMVQSYQRRHHYEQLDPQEFAFQYPQVEPTPASAYTLMPPASDAELLATLAAHAKPVAYMQQVYTTVPFKLNSAHLTKANQEMLRAVVEGWRHQGVQVMSVAVTGHTDATGPQQFNYQLSRWRAESVSYFLSRFGIPKKAITTGGAAMLAPNPNARSDADNRYVDLRVWLLPADDAGNRVAMVTRPRR